MLFFVISLPKVLSFHTWMLFSHKRGIQPDPENYLCNKNINVSDSVKYLGIYFDKKLTFYASPIVRFVVISIEFPKIDRKDLSTDQQYLWDICQAATNGNCSLGLLQRLSGKISHAR